ncbi:hypothetical protein ACIHJG_40000 [Streptomyces sp. NPDC052415]|uniref:DinB/UmuC family translesion DNA polymerase n=1 Tax=Streptomyces sp. NPDC052415 TaxID=3365690 RepID=UPI0037CEFBD3
MADDLSTRLRSSGHIATGLTVTLRYADGGATRRGRTLAEPTQHTVFLARTAYAVYGSLGLQRARVRSIALRADALRSGDRATRQLTLDAQDDKIVAIEAVADRARTRYGHQILYPAALATHSLPRLPDAGAPTVDRIQIADEQRHHPADAQEALQAWSAVSGNGRPRLGFHAATPPPGSLGQSTVAAARLTMKFPPRAPLTGGVGQIVGHADMRPLRGRGDGPVLRGGSERCRWRTLPSRGQLCRREERLSAAGRAG